jgi:invasion protein IalB
MSVVRLLAAVAGLAIAIAPAAAKTPKARQFAQKAEPQKAQPEQKAPPLPYRTEILNFDHWTVTCRDFHEGPNKHICSAELKVTKSGSNQVLLEWAIGLSGDNKPIALIQTLTGVLIEPGVTLELGKSVRKLSFASCFPTHCTASMPVDAKFVRDVSTASAAAVIIQAPNGKSIKFSFPTTGFEKAYAALRH